MKSREEYLKGLPKKRMGSGALIFNEKDEILFLETTYKDTWEIPGGVVELNESPNTCCKREIHEEIGLKLEINKLLCLEYQQEEYDDSMMFVFDGGVISKRMVDKIILCDNEIKTMHFSLLEDAKQFLKGKMFRRIKKALIARQNKNIEYIETLKNG